MHGDDNAHGFAFHARGYVYGPNGQCARLRRPAFNTLKAPEP